MSVEVDDKEFVVLTAESIHKLLHSDRAEPAERRRRRERRRVERWPFPGPVQLWVKDLDGEETEVLATCENLNEWGIGISAPRPFEVGARLPIAIHQPEATYHGEGVVRHCTPSNGVYFVGIELVEG